MNGLYVGGERIPVSDAGRLLVVSLLALALTVTAGSAIVASVPEVTGATGEPGDDPDASVAVGQATAVEDADVNETIRHQNPDEYADEGDAAGMEAWLSDELTDRLVGSAAEVEDGNYDDARELVGEDYQQRQAQHAEITGETIEGSDADLYDAAGAEQLRLIESAESYEELREEYEQALEDGDEELARELARDLEENATEAQEASDGLSEVYDELEVETGEDFSDASATADGVETALEREQEEIREAEFVETELTVEADGENVSYLEALSLEGELETANGSAVADEEIQLDVGSETTTVETDGDGAFDLEYRPTDEPLETDEVAVEFVPVEGSTYLGAETSIDVSIEQVEPTIDDLEVTDETASGEDLAVEGALVVEDEPVDEVTLEVALDEEVLGEVNVTEGSFDESLEVPASVADGDRELTVTLPYEDQALAETTETASVTVLETETDLSVDATRTDDEEVVVDGVRETAAGEPLENETVEVSVGEQTDPVTLDDDGEFEEILPPPDDAGGDVPVTVTYDGEGTSFADAEAETTLSLSESGVSALTAPVPVWAWFLLGLLAVVAFAGGLRRYRGESPAFDGATGFGVDRSESDRRLTGPEVTDALLSRAAEEQADGRSEAAVGTCYVAVRRELADRIDVNRGLTHWEFYRQWRRDGTDDLDALLFDLTEAYERATFDTRGLSSEDAAGLLERTRRLLEDAAE